MSPAARRMTFRDIERSFFDLYWHMDPVAATQAGVPGHDDRYGRFGAQALAPQLSALKSIASALRMREGGRLLVREMSTALAAQAPAQAARLKAAAEEAGDALKKFDRDLKRWLETGSDHFAIGEEAFNFLLHYQHALRDTAPELWRYGLRLKEEIEADLARLGARLDGGGSSWPDLVDKLRADHPGPSELVDAYAKEMGRARDFVAAKKLAPIPEPPLG